MAKKPSWQLSKEHKEVWDGMVYQAGLADCIDKATPQDKAILAMNKHLFYLERHYGDKTRVASLLLKARKGEL